jgi:hypothetical protein
MRSNKDSAVYTLCSMRLDHHPPRAWGRPRSSASSALTQCSDGFGMRVMERMSKQGDLFRTLAGKDPTPLRPRKIILVRFDAPFSAWDTTCGTMRPLMKLENAPVFSRRRLPGTRVFRYVKSPTKLFVRRAKPRGGSGRIEEPSIMARRW